LGHINTHQNVSYKCANPVFINLLIAQISHPFSKAGFINIAEQFKFSVDSGAG
jgi:hypothetical protein